MKRVTENKKQNWIRNMERVKDIVLKTVLEIEECGVPPYDIDHLQSLSCEADEAIGEIQDLD